jgi:spoIIIJ-associated protein
VEWVETTGKTVEEAKDAALDQLGVDEQDAEFEVVEEPRTGLFGRMRGEARVRARVRPTQPRPKLERRDRRARTRSGKPGDRRKGRDSGARRSGEGATTGAAEPTGGVATEAEPAPEDRAARPEGAAAGPRRSRRGGRGGSNRSRDAGQADRDDDEGSIEMRDTELAEQGEVLRTFLVDLLDAFGLDGEVTATPAEEGAVELAVDGADLGLLIGPKGQTLQAVQELSRSVLQRQKPGEVHARIRVDVGGYRERRRAALERFVRDVAAQVKESGERKALEPMSPPDRKVVHDTVNEIEGVSTVSEGEDARRRVVILPG